MSKRAWGRKENRRADKTNVVCVFLFWMHLVYRYINHMSAAVIGQNVLLKNLSCTSNCFIKQAQKPACVHLVILFRTIRPAITFGHDNFIWAAFESRKTTNEFWQPCNKIPLGPCNQSRKIIEWMPRTLNEHVISFL